MGIRDVVRLITDGGERPHYECRVCGKNLTAGVDQCPDCGGGVVRYDL